jgi:hypothetical protein
LNVSSQKEGGRRGRGGEQEEGGRGGGGGERGGRKRSCSKLKGHNFLYRYSPDGKISQ